MGALQEVLAPFTWSHMHLTQTIEKVKERWWDPEELQVPVLPQRMT